MPLLFTPLLFTLLLGEGVGLMLPPELAFPNPVRTVATTTLSCRRCGSSDHPKHCAELTEVTLLFGLWYSAYAGASAAVVRRFDRIRRLLNPISSGVVSIQSV